MNNRIGSWPRSIFSTLIFPCRHSTISPFPLLCAVRGFVFLAIDFPAGTKVECDRYVEGNQFQVSPANSGTARNGFGRLICIQQRAALGAAFSNESKDSAAYRGQNQEKDGSTLVQIDRDDSVSVSYSAVWTASVPAAERTSIALRESERSLWLSAAVGVTEMSGHRC